MMHFYNTSVIQVLPFKGTGKEIRGGGEFPSPGIAGSPVIYFTVKIIYFLHINNRYNCKLCPSPTSAYILRAPLLLTLQHIYLHFLFNQITTICLNSTYTLNKKKNMQAPMKLILFPTSYITPFVENIQFAFNFSNYF